MRMLKWLIKRGGGSSESVQKNESEQKAAARISGSYVVKGALITLVGTLITLAGTLIVARMNRDTTLKVQEEAAAAQKAQKETAAPVNAGTNPSPPVQPTGLPKPANLVLDQFTINAEDSLFERCTQNDACGAHWTSRVQWVPTAEWQAAVDLEGESVAAIRKELPENPVQKRAWLNYAEDPGRYKTRMNPVFDAVISNPGTETKVLTGIDVVVLHSDPRAQGDGEASGSSAVIPVLNRYSVALKGWKLDNKRAPFTISQAATPPIAVAPNRPARFQVALVCEMGVQWDFVMRVRFDFGGGTKLQTDRFALTC